MTDRIKVEGLEVAAHVGVYAHEQGVEQSLVIDVIAETDTRRAADLDSLNAAVDYDRLAEFCRSVVVGQHHALIETVAERIATRVLETQGAKVERVHVRVSKPGAVPDARTVAVEIVRP